MWLSIAYSRSSLRWCGISERMNSLPLRGGSLWIQLYPRTSNWPMGLLPDSQNCWNAGNISPRHWLLRKPLVNDPSMHHGTGVKHVPWCMSGSLTYGGGENVPVIPGACATRNFAYLVRGPWETNHLASSHIKPIHPRIDILSICCTVSNLFLMLLLSGYKFTGFFSCDQAALWMVQSVRPSVCLSVCPSVTLFWLCSHHRIIMKFSGVITSDRSDVHAKCQGQRSKVKVTEVNTQLSHFRTVTPVWI